MLLKILKVAELLFDAIKANQYYLKQLLTFQLQIILKKNAPQI
jgi:hypothetical protein